VSEDPEGSGFDNSGFLITRNSRQEESRNPENPVGSYRAGDVCSRSHENGASLGELMREERIGARRIASQREG
jgi:hypothetical protein